MRGPEGGVQDLGEGWHEGDSHANVSQADPLSHEEGPGNEVLVKSYQPALLLLTVPWFAPSQDSSVGITHPPTL